MGDRARKALAAFTLLALASLGSATAQSGGVTTSYGYAVFGELKYREDFDHTDYVNPDAPKGGSFSMAQPGSFDSLNQAALLGTFPPTLMFLADTLLEQSRDEPASYYCMICTSVTWPSDLSWVEFELDPRARFTDGSPVTVDDVLFSYSLKDGITLPAFSRLKQISTGARQVGPRRVRIEFAMKDNPTPITVIGLMPVLSRRNYRGRDPFKPSLELPVFSSPYRIERAEAGRTIVYRRDPDYWAKDHPLNKGRFNFDTIRHDYYRDPQMQNEAFRTGMSDLRVDTTNYDPRNDRNLAAVKAGEIRRMEVPYENGTIWNGINLNARTPFLGDRRVRKAVVLAFDYEWVNRAVLGGKAGRTESNFPNSPFAATGLPNPGELAVLEPYRASLPPEVFTREPYLPPGGSRANMRRNLTEARNLLRQAGYRVVGGKLRDPKTGEPIRLRLVTYAASLISSCSLFIDNMAKLGIEVSFRNVDSAQLRHLARTHDYDLYYYRNGFAPLPTPGAGMAQIWSSAAADDPNMLNYSGVKNPAIDAAMVRLIAATDRRTVVDMMRATDRVARWEYYNIPLNHLYPTPVGLVPISYWNKFGMPATAPTYGFAASPQESWWYDPAKAGRLRHGIRR